MMKYYHLHLFSSLWWNIFTLIEIYHVMSIWSKIYLNDENKIHHVKSILLQKSTILIKFHTKNKTVNLNELSIPWWDILFWLELIMVCHCYEKCTTVMKFHQFDKSLLISRKLITWVDIYNLDVHYQLWWKFIILMKLNQNAEISLLF